MNKKTVMSNIIKVLLSIGIIILSAYAFYALVLHNGIVESITLLCNTDSSIPPAALVLLGMAVLLLLLGITYLFTAEKSISTLFYWILMFFAFTSLPDMMQLVKIGQMLSGGDNAILTFDFDLLRNLSLLGEFPKELVFMLILLCCMLRIDKFYIKKKEIVLLTLSLLLCVAMLILPELSNLLLFVAIYPLLIMAHGLFNEFMKSVDKRYEKIIAFSLILILVGKCVFRALLIINSYLLV
ncbi:MAG: hypothetical protein IJ397_03000 [Lachnospiraceae bacterium]|nr:hypothetical protein [Lachnospiraceae bacterium]